MNNATKMAPTSSRDVWVLIKKLLFEPQFLDENTSIEV